MKALGIVGIIAGIILIVAYFPGLFGNSGMAPQVIAGAVVIVISVLLFRRASRARP
jgi:hypothetical protein